jgi:carbon starvation protein
MRFVGYFGAVGEGLLALGTIIATTAGFRTLADWEAIYTAFNQGGVNAFVAGGGSLINEGLGIPTSLSATILATMAVLFAATTMDTGVRLQRFVVQEIGEIVGVKLNALVATAIVIVVALGLTFSAGGDGSGGMLIWPLFGTTNQLMAALTLSIIAVILTRLRRPTWPVLIPLVFVLVMSLWAAVVQLQSFWDAQNWLLLAIDVVILISAIWVTVEAFAAMRRARTEPAVVWSDDDTDAPAPAVAGTGTATATADQKL